MNLGQLATLVRARYLFDAHSHTQVNGMPFKAEQLAAVLKQAMHTPHPTQQAQAARPHQAKEAIDG